MRSLSGKTVVITGASSGTGRATAYRLREAGARVVPIGGSAETIEPVARALGAPPLWADFASFAEVRRLGSRLLETTGTIDVLALNAGAIIPRARLTGDGVEINLQVNAISHWLLLQLLSNRIAGGRVIATSSQTHIPSVVNPEDLATASGLGWHGVYARAKLVQGILLREHARRHPDVDVGDFHPGVIASQIGRHLGVVGAVAARLAKPFSNTPEDGAARLLHLVTLEQGLDGRYFEGDRPRPGSPQLRDRALALAL